MKIFNPLIKNNKVARNVYGIMKIEESLLNGLLNDINESFFDIYTWFYYCLNSDFYIFGLHEL